MPFWAVVRAAPNRERLACESVVQAGFEIFVPKIRVRIGVQWRTMPLFGCYFFARVINQWRKLERSPGVVSVIKFGPTPARCPDEDIGALIERGDRDGVIRLPPRPPQSFSRAFVPGSTVTIADGPLRGLSALHTGMSTHDREAVLIDLLGRQTSVAVPAGLVLPH
jgi:transcriptional antiterminator RfaH